MIEKDIYKRNFLRIGLVLGLVLVLSALLVWDWWSWWSLTYFFGIFIVWKYWYYIVESYNELLNKVSWPTWSELQSSSIVVAIASAIIALIIYLMDQTFSNIMDVFYSLFA